MSVPGPEGLQRVAFSKVRDILEFPPSTLTRSAYAADSLEPAEGCFEPYAGPHADGVTGVFVVRASIAEWLADGVVGDVWGEPEIVLAA